MSSVSVYNEWDPIEEIIVGSACYANFPGHDDKMFELTRAAHHSDMLDDATSYPMRFPEKIIEETEEDINLFIGELKKLGIRVRRPVAIESKNKVRTLDWEVEHYFCYCPRDLLLAIGDLIIECPSGFRSRYLETFSYQEILLDYMKGGARWISAPKPRLLDSTYDASRASRSILNNQEPIFDAANILRAGKDIFYLVSDSGNELGGQWLQSILGENYKIHHCKNIYSSTHIDTTFCLLRPGLVLISQRVNRDYLPEPLKKWDILVCPDMVEVNYSNISPICSIWLGMNLLMLSPNLAVVDKHQLPLIKLLKKQGIDVIPILLRHGRILGGGPHCITLDVKRSGSLESYF